mgnify:FL=1
MVRKVDPWNRHSGMIGVVIEIHPVLSWATPTVRVVWPKDYGTFWTTMDTLEVVSHK